MDLRYFFVTAKKFSF